METDAKVMIVDCDHDTVEFERAVLVPRFGELPWCHFKTEDEIITNCTKAQGLLVQYAPMTERVLATLDSCRAIVRYGVGVDTIDLEAAAEHGIVVSNVPDYGIDEVSDHALALILTLVRKIYRAERLVRQGSWDFSKMRPIRRINTLTLGIIGLGRIGNALATKALPLGFKLVACDPYLPSSRRNAAVDFLDLDELLEVSDIVSVHCPLDSTTHNLISKVRIDKMKDGAFFVNTARGGIVDETALAEALIAGRIAGVALDVLSVEPMAPDHPLIDHPDFICTPHMAWHSISAEQDLKRKAAEELVRILDGEEPRYQVNRRAR